MNKKLFLSIVLVAVSCMAMAADKVLKVASPDGKIGVEVTVGKQLTYSVSMDGNVVLAPSAMAMSLTNGTVWGENCQLKKSTKKAVNATITSPFTRQAEMTDACNELTLQFRGYNVIVRAYDNGVAYRFVSTTKGAFEVEAEKVEYCFTADNIVTTPYIRDYEAGKTTFKEQFNNSFENIYSIQPVSQMDKKRLSFLPLVVDLGNGRKMCITETALERYPGLYLVGGADNKLTSMHAPLPKTWHQGGHNELQLLVDETHPFIAKVNGPREFPWRVAMLSREDKELAANNLSYILASPSRVADYSWVKPGKVAWDWWNDWNIEGVDFEAGINNATYKYYIDFASANGIEYVILDEGWAVNLQADLMQVIPEINIKELVDYGKQKNVDIILWAGYYAFDRDMENVVKHYADMGVKGFKIDFMDRDDQIVSDFYWRAAETCAKYHMLADFHGAFKPAGLNRTYPNVINFEGVSGLEQMKWEPTSRDQITYDCQLPFTRQTAGPMDYTQGAMHNAGHNYYPCYSEPMSQGTRCHQLGMYIVLESPLNMLCDSPTNYMAEPECTRCIAEVPTVWDETHVLAGEMGKYCITARRKGDVWYVGGINNWDARTITFTLPEGINLSKKGDLFRDGKNANRKGTDYKREQVSLTRQMTITMADGGGFIMKI